jgi:hypothetical protein
MDMQNFKNKLKKIAALSDNGNSEGQFSSLEKDLLLSYIRELYDITLDDKIMEAKPKQPVNNEKPIPANNGNSLSVIYETVKEVSEVMSAPIASLQGVLAKEGINKDAGKGSKHNEAEKIVTDGISEALNEIFAEDIITDLSDKLSHTPVNDLTRSMGINEKIFTQQELFGNDQKVFNETLMQLNNFVEFKDAKQYLIEHIIGRFDWVSENKVKKAATFVRLIKRKYV